MYRTSNNTTKAKKSQKKANNEEVKGMYVNQFAMGVFSTIFVEMAIVLGYALYVNFKK